MFSNTKMSSEYLIQTKLHEIYNIALVGLAQCFAELRQVHIVASLQYIHQFINAIVVCLLSLYNSRTLPPNGQHDMQLSLQL